MEELVRDLQAYGITTELLVAQMGNNLTRYGVRLRTFSRKLPKNKMILCAGPSFLVALQEAIKKAEDGRWEDLEWASRPWDQPDFTEVKQRYGI